jgi:plastocyanin
MRRETLDRGVLPVAIPVAAIIGIAFFVFFFSRILLAVAAVEGSGPILATLIALGMSLNVLTASALVAALPRLRTPIIVGALVVGAIFLGGAGTLAMALSDEASLTGGEATEHGRPGGGGPAEPTCEPSGTKLTITAPPGAISAGFDKNCLAVPAGKPFTIDFDNQDEGLIHNVNIYTDPSTTESLLHEKSEGGITGPDSTTYEGEPLEPGRYFFQCDFHPTMKGTFIVE